MKPEPKATTYYEGSSVVIHVVKIGFIPHTTVVEDKRDGSRYACKNFGEAVLKRRELMSSEV